MNRKHRFQLVVGAILLCVAVSTFLFVRQFLRQQQKFTGLKQICLALHQYHERWGTFPPSEWKNELGTPLSYRVLLMSHFETEDAKGVFSEAQTVASVPELENSTTFQKWRDTKEGQQFLNSRVEFVPVIGQWPSWGKPSREVSKQRWNDWLIPMIVAVDVKKRPNWCEPSVAAMASDKTIVLKSGDLTEKTLYSSCDCTIHEVGRVALVK